MNKTCAICGSTIKHGHNPVAAALWHFRPFDLSQLPWVRGTLRCFGVDAALCLISPAFNTIRHWKYRKYKLTCQFRTLEDL